MLSYSELKKGSRIVIEKQPYEIIEASTMFKGRGSSVLQTKIKNLITGNVISKTVRSTDSFEEADIKKIKNKFIYSNKGKFFFQREDNSKRFELSDKILGETILFLKPNESIDAIEFQEEIINISLPVKVNLKVIEAPPGIKGDRSQAGTKVIILETGAKINAPLFIKEGDMIEVNTETREYVRRI